jgi:hypothetical protein
LRWVVGQCELETLPYLNFRLNLNSCMFSADRYTTTSLPPV